MDPTTIINLITSLETAVSGLQDALNASRDQVTQMALRMQRDILLGIIASLKAKLQSGPTGTGWTLPSGPTIGPAIEGMTPKPEPEEDHTIAEIGIGIIGHLIGGIIGGIISAPIGSLINPSRLATPERILETAKYKIGSKCFKVEWYQTEDDSAVRVRISETPC